MGYKLLVGRGGAEYEIVDNSGHWVRKLSDAEAGQRCFGCESLTKGSHAGCCARIRMADGKKPPIWAVVECPKGKEVGE